MLTRQDAVLAVSYGGETEEILALLETIERLGVPIVTLTGNPKSTLAAASKIVLDIHVSEEACSLNLAPTASTAAAMAMGDALAIALLERRGFREGDFAALHPKGRLGMKLLRAENLMHSGESLPRVDPATKLTDVIYEMSRKGLGMTTVVGADGRLAGIVTDGDLRRVMQKRGPEIFHAVASECMTREPATIGPAELASHAFRVMEERHITSLVVVDGDRRPLGVLHLHDLWTLDPS
jgi:arabinose-5-phosphate isomerase